MKKTLLRTLSLLVLAMATAFAKPSTVLNKTTNGNPTLKTIDVISFAPEGVLLIGDGQGSQVVAVRTGDLASAKPLAKAIPAIDAKLAGVVGAKADGIEILDLAVNPASGKAYFAIRKQDDKRYLILTVDGNGKIAEFSLDKVEFARVSLAGGKSTIKFDPRVLLRNIKRGEDVMKKIKRYQDSGSTDSLKGGPIEKHASGGNVSAGRPYIVGEIGEELFVPEQDGYIVPHGMFGGSQNIVLLNQEGDTIVQQAPASSGGGTRVIASNPFHAAAKYAQMTSLLTV